MPDTSNMEMVFLSGKVVPVTSHHLHSYIMLLMCSQLQLSYLDKIKTTPFYRQEFKNAIKGLERILISFINQDLDKLWGVSDTEMYAIMEGQEQILNQIVSHARAENYPLIAEVIRRTLENPDEVIKKLNIQ